MKARFLHVLTAGLLLAGCSREEKKAEAASAKQPEPIEMRTAAVETRKIDKTISVTGSLHPDETVSVSAEVPGRVSAILVDFGQNVRKGQVIAELDKQELNLALERSKACSGAGSGSPRSGSRAGECPPRLDSVHPSGHRADGRRASRSTTTPPAWSRPATSRRSVSLKWKRFISRGRPLSDAARDETRTLFANVQALKAEVKLAQKRLNDATVRAPVRRISRRRSSSLRARI